MQTNSTFTPGPWRIGDAGHTVFGPPNGNPSPITIAHVGKRPNARLIAAAPDMYDALRLFLSLMPSDEGLGGHAPIAAFSVAARAARQALAPLA